MSSAEQRRVARIGLSVDVLSVGGVRVCDVCRWVLACVHVSVPNIELVY